ncbi:hypothetical protein TNCV_3431431 [Trichonephila clavipes]|nr:hypothetical protein TNCV_3431431 [Trichonephila clavipes]
MLKHSPYSPDLAPYDLYMFLKGKNALMGTHFQSLEESATRREAEFNEGANLDLKDGQPTALNNLAQLYSESLMAVEVNFHLWNKLDPSETTTMYHSVMYADLAQQHCKRKQWGYRVNDCLLNRCHEPKPLQSIEEL